MKEFENIFVSLKMDRQNGLYRTTEKEWKGKLPERMERLIVDKLKPEAFFCIDNKPLVLFYDSPPHKKELFKAVWNFNESPVVIINEPDALEIFNGLSYLKQERRLEHLEEKENLDEFSYFKLITGKTWQKYEHQFKYRNRVDYKLLENIRAARDRLISEFQCDSALANALIGKCIFIRYLIDREVRMKSDGQLRAWTNDEFCELLKDKNRTIRFLDYLTGHFNGEAFLIEDSRLNAIADEAFNTLSELMRGTEIATGQMSLFDIYDFSIIPVEFISNVYEHFIGSENQARKGAYYTPLFLVDYMIRETVETYFETNTTEYNCKVLDPACGSGIFLVEALRRMIEQYQKIYKKSSTGKEILKKIAEDNIFGIDQDENAINVAIFSVYLALLDYKEPREIEDFKFPKLIGRNFFVSDFFNLDAAFNSTISNLHFDFILGNPPWKRGSDTHALFLNYIEERKKRESGRADGRPPPIISNKERAQAFLLRTSDFSTIQTACALIVTSKTLYNLNARKFRNYFLHHFFIDKVFELSPVRKEVFDKSNDPSVAPAAILFFRCAHDEPTGKNIVEHITLKPNRFFSLFKIFMLQRNDYKQVVQSRLMEYDWLWKTLVYGSYMDFNFIKRLKGGYQTIGGIVDDEEEFLVKQGLKRKDGNKKINVEEIVGWDFLDTGSKRKELEQFFIKPEHEKWHQKEVGYIYRDSSGHIYTELFRPPCAVVKDGITPSFLAVSALIRSPVIFTDSITAIKPKSNNGEEKLANIVGLLNSSLCGYYTIMTASVAGIERERSHDKEKFEFPYTDNKVIAGYVGKIEAVSKKLFERKQEAVGQGIQTLEDERQSLIEKLNDEIFTSFNLDEQERVLVDYVRDITIPLIMKPEGYEKKLFSPIDFKSSLLEDYIDIFLTRFKTSFREKRLEAKVWHSRSIVGIFYKVVPGNPAHTRLIEWQKKENDDLLKKISSLGVGKITDNLFIQKDIRGFEEEGFYIVKPNEKKLWHKAIGYLDVNDFIDAILTAGKEAYNG